MVFRLYRVPVTPGNSHNHETGRVRMVGSARVTRNMAFYFWRPATFRSRWIMVRLLTDLLTRSKKKAQKNVSVTSARRLHPCLQGHQKHPLALGFLLFAIRRCSSISTLSAVRHASQPPVCVRTVRPTCRNQKHRAFSCPAARRERTRMELRATSSSATRR